jgi:hypothetical protein
MADELAKKYNRLKKLAVKDLKSKEVSAELAAICHLSLDFLRGSAKLVSLISNVPNKKYAMAQLKASAKTSRPINTDLFDIAASDNDLAKVLAGEVEDFLEPRLNQLLYTSAMSFCLAVDLTGEGNKKSPGTFFEIFVAHLAAVKFNANPSKKVAVPFVDVENTLPTDFIFDLGPLKSKIHLPVKASTRERAVQAWAHQRVLEGMLGLGRYRGILVVLAETNKQKEVSVAEVCTPGQWAAYQMYIAPLYRIYYLDLPKAYEPLRDNYPFIQIWPFAKFFGEYQHIENPAP